MAKITLNTIASGFNLQVINDNFQTLVNELNDEVLYRSDVSGEPNQMAADFDMNGNFILNCQEAVNDADVPTWGQVKTLAFTGNGDGDDLIFNDGRYVRTANVSQSINGDKTIEDNLNIFDNRMRIRGTSGGGKRVLEVGNSDINANVAVEIRDNWTSNVNIHEFWQGVFLPNGRIWSKSSGSAGAPTYSWQSDITTGSYNITTGAIGWSCAGQAVMALSVLGLIMSADCNLQGNNLVDVGDPLGDGHGMSRLYADNRYIQSAGTPGVSVAGGKITSTGSGAQNIANCFGVSACVVNGLGFRVTLTTPIAVDDDMLLQISGPPAAAPIIYNINRVDDSNFDCFVVFSDHAANPTWTAAPTAGLFFNFDVKNAGA